MKAKKIISNNIYLHKAAKASGEKLEETKARMQEYSTRAGVGYKEYYEKGYFKLTKEEHEEKLQKLERKLKKKQLKKKYAALLSEQTGWSEKESLAKLTEAKKNIGVSYKRYVDNKFYELNEAEQKKLYDELEKKAARRKRTEGYVQTVADEAGWSYEEALEKMRATKERCGAFFKNYVEYRFWELDEETQDSYFNNGHIRQLMAKYNNAPGKMKLFRSKKEFNTFFADYIGRAWCFNKDLNPETFTKTFGDCKKLIYKPERAGRGMGVQVFELHDDNKEKVLEEIQQLPPGVVEEYLKQHPEVGKFSNNVSVNTIRVLSVLDHGECYIPYAVIRIGRGEKPLDHIHHGGMLGPVDPETGVIYTAAIDSDGNYHENHPVTGYPIVGFQIPYWNEVKEMIAKALKMNPDVGFIGWDVAILEDRPVLIEGNSCPAADNVQLPFMASKTGNRHLFDKFLTE